MDNNEKKSSYILIAEFAMMAFYLFMGISIFLFTKEVMTILCKIAFGIMVFLVGIYSIIGYARHKEGKTIFDMFSGVSMSLIGGYMLFNSELVIRLLPCLFGCILIPGGYYTLKKGFDNKEVGGIIWKILVFGSLIEIALVASLILRPMKNLQMSTLITGVIFIIEGLLFIIMLFLSGKKVLFKVPEKGKIADLIDENKEQAKKFTNKLKKEKNELVDKLEKKVNNKSEESIEQGKSENTSSENKEESQDKSLETVENKEVNETLSEIEDSTNDNEDKIKENYNEEIKEKISDEEVSIDEKDVKENSQTEQ